MKQISPHDLRPKFNARATMPLDQRIKQMEGDLTPSQRIFYDEFLRDQDKARHQLAERQNEGRPILLEQAFAQHLARKSAQAKLTLTPRGMKGPTQAQLRDEAGRLAVHQIEQLNNHQKIRMDTHLFAARWNYLNSAQERREQQKSNSAQARTEFNRNNKGENER